MEKDIHRKQQLITYLIKKTNWVTTKKLAQRLDCSEKTIRKDIKQLLCLLPTDWKIEAQKGKGIQLFKNNEVSLQQVFAILVQNTLQFQILNHIFFHNNSSITNLSESLFVQPTMIKQQMKHIRKKIATYELTLTSRAMQLNGHEWQIRMYYFQFFSDSYEPRQWPFRMYKQECLKNYVQMLGDILQVDFSLASQKHLLYWLAISFYRIQNGDMVDKATLLDIEVKETSFFNKLQPFFKMIEDQENIVLNEQEKIFFTLVIFSQSFTYRKILEVRSMKLQRFSEKKLKNVNPLYDLLEQCKKALGVNIFSHEHIIFSLIEYFQKQALFLSFPPVFQRPFNKMEKYVQVQYKDLFHQVQQIYGKWAQHYDFYPENNEIVTTLTLYIQTVVMLKNENRIKLLYITTAGPVWQHYVYAQLQAELGNQVQVLELETERITQEMVEQLQVQIIITDIPTILLVPAVIKVDTIFTARDWKNIKRTIGTFLGYNRDLCKNKS